MFFLGFIATVAFLLLCCAYFVLSIIKGFVVLLIYVIYAISLDGIFSFQMFYSSVECAVINCSNPLSLSRSLSLSLSRVFSTPSFGCHGIKFGLFLLLEIVLESIYEGA
ncbi:hypothetical protein AMTRI_Chr02g265690 [Amborella trichopoda]